MPPANVDSAAHIVQLALTPIFLLTAIAGLLNAFTNRLGRIADQVDQLATKPDADHARFARLRTRSQLLDVAVLLAAVAGALTCCAAVTLFLGAIRTGGGSLALFALFGAALACAIAALVAFAAEMVLAGRSVRQRVDDEARREGVSRSDR